MRELTQAQYERIAPHLPVQRGNVSLSNQQVLNAILYVAEHGCKWRGLPARFGNWHTLYTRMNRWSKNGVLDRVPRAVALEASCLPRKLQVSWIPLDKPTTLQKGCWSQQHDNPSLILTISLGITRNEISIYHDDDGPFEAFYVNRP